MMPNLALLRGFGQWIPRASTQRTAATSSGPGWTSVLTGVEPAKHRITANANYASRDPAWPTFLARARGGLRLRTSVAAHWPDILQIVEADALDERSTGDDNTVAANMASTLRAGSADVHFIHLDDVDHAGHGSGFSIANPNYVAAIQGVDLNLGRMLDGLFERPTLAREFWLVVFVTDHGGEGTTHGPMNAANQQIPVGYLGPGATFALPTRGLLSHMDVHPTVMHFLGATPAPDWRLDGRDLYAPFESLCADGADDDGDGRADCADPDCASEASCACVVTDAGSALGRAIATGTMAGRADTARGSCGGASLLDAAVTWTAPSAGTFSFDTAGSVFSMATVDSVAVICVTPRVGLTMTRPVEPNTLMPRTRCSTLTIFCPCTSGSSRTFKASTFASAFLVGKAADSSLCAKNASTARRASSSLGLAPGARPREAPRLALGAMPRILVGSPVRGSSWTDRLGFDLLAPAMALRTSGSMLDGCPCA
jgi:hypothetical protein